jgi:hypothetical protein
VVCFDVFDALVSFDAEDTVVAVDAVFVVSVISFYNLKYP